MGVFFATMQSCKKKKKNLNKQTNKQKTANTVSHKKLTISSQSTLLV